jgi:hypothetical protein
MGFLHGAYPGRRQLLSGAPRPHGHPFNHPRGQCSLHQPGALNKVKDLPPYSIPTQCSHLDILKNIMANCSNLSFSWLYSHVKAHQDNGKVYGNLTRDAQLNCQMDYLAKRAIYKAQAPQEAPARWFPIKPICVFLGRSKLTSDKGERLRFWVHKQLARSWFHDASILFANQFKNITEPEKVGIKLN